MLGMGIPSVFQLFSLPFTWFMLVAALLWSFAQEDTSVRSLRHAEVRNFRFRR
ncbi:hypothetical protein VQ056_33350 [Paenibacillus sp. JTLBN-2024]